MDPDAQVETAHGKFLWSSAKKKTRQAVHVCIVPDSQAWFQYHHAPLKYRIHVYSVTYPHVTVRRKMAKNDVVRVRLSRL